MEAIKNRPADADGDVSILEELLIRGMTLKEATVMVVDMLMAGIDTVPDKNYFQMQIIYNCNY